MSLTFSSPLPAIVGPDNPMRQLLSIAIFFWGFGGVLHAQGHVPRTVHVSVECDADRAISYACLNGKAMEIAAKLADELHKESTFDAFVFQAASPAHRPGCGELRFRLGAPSKMYPLTARLYNCRNPIDSGKDLFLKPTQVGPDLTNPEARPVFPADAVKALHDALPQGAGEMLAKLRLQIPFGTTARLSNPSLLLTREGLETFLPLEEVPNQSKTFQPDSYGGMLFQLEFNWNGDQKLKMQAVGCKSEVHQIRAWLDEQAAKDPDNLKKLSHLAPDNLFYLLDGEGSSTLPGDCHVPASSN